MFPNKTLSKTFTKITSFFKVAFLKKQLPKKTCKELKLIDRLTLGLPGNIGVFPKKAYNMI